MSFSTLLLVPSSSSPVSQMRSSAVPSNLFNIPAIQLHRLEGIPPHALKSRSTHLQGMPSSDVQPVLFGGRQWLNLEGCAFATWKCRNIGRAALFCSREKKKFPNFHITQRTILLTSKIRGVANTRVILKYISWGDSSTNFWVRLIHGCGHYASICGICRQPSMLLLQYCKFPTQDEHSTVSYFATVRTIANTTRNCKQ